MGEDDKEETDDKDEKEEKIEKKMIVIKMF